jgi:hypothetical protein
MLLQHVFFRMLKVCQLHGWLAERMVPAAFILMKRRRTKDYNELFKVLSKEVIRLGLVLDPTVII